MRKFIEDLFALALLIGAEAWFLKGYFAGQPDFEPALAFLAALGVILAKEPVRAHFARSPESASVHDQALLRAFLEALPPNQTTRFFKEQDFGASFPRAAVTPLHDFVAAWGSVDKEFLDGELEQKRKALYAFASDLASEIAARTVPLRDTEFMGVFSDQQRATGLPRPDSVIEDARVLNDKSSSFVPVYENFVRTCKARLGR